MPFLVNKKSKSPSRTDQNQNHPQCEANFLKKSENYPLEESPKSREAKNLFEEQRFAYEAENISKSPSRIVFSTSYAKCCSLRVFLAFLYLGSSPPIKYLDTEPGQGLTRAKTLDPTPGLDRTQNQILNTQPLTPTDLFGLDPSPGLNLPKKIKPRVIFWTRI